MNIAILGGTGREGRGLGPRWARAGHRVRLGSRDEARGKEKAEALGLEGGGYAFALEEAEVVVLTVPYAAHADTLAAVHPLLARQPLLDLTVPLRPPRVREVHLPPGGSAAMEGAAILGDRAQVVAGLHHVSSAHLSALDRALSGDVLLCSDHPEALSMVARLVADLGFRPLDAGPLRNAVALEALTPVLLHINHRYGGNAGIVVTGLPDVG